MATVTIGGRTYEVEVRGETVVVDGHEYPVKVRDEGAYLTVHAGGIPYRVQLPPAGVLECHARPALPEPGPADAVADVRAERAEADVAAGAHASASAQGHLPDHRLWVCWPRRIVVAPSGAGPQDVVADLEPHVLLAPASRPEDVLGLLRVSRRRRPVAADVLRLGHPASAPLDVVIDGTTFAHATAGARGARLAALIVGTPKENA